MKFFIAFARGILIAFNLILLNFQPNTETEIEMFFAARIVFFVMLIIDYSNVAYYNRGLERIIGVMGVLMATVFAVLDGAGLFNFLVLNETNSGYVISGNENNLLTSSWGPFSIQFYVLSSWTSVMVLLGIEVFNHGIRGVIDYATQTKAKAA